MVLAAWLQSPQGFTVVGTNCAASDTIAQSVILSDLQSYVDGAIPSSVAAIDSEIQGNSDLIIIDTKGCNSLISLLGHTATDAPDKTGHLPVGFRCHEIFLFK